MIAPSAEASIRRRLEQPVNGQYLRPWMTDMERPEEALVFIVGRNPATAFPVDKFRDLDMYIDALYNRNGELCRELYKRIRGPKDSSDTRENISYLCDRLAKRDINDIIETNVICYATPKSKDLKQPEHQGGKEAGIAMFLEILGIIRPIVLIVHGVGTKKELEQLLWMELPTAASKQADRVSRKRVCMRVWGERYEPMVFVIPSLAKPRWSHWQEWAPRHLDELCSEVRKFLDDYQLAVGA
jgi:hypothetical protein